jgi:hypothetical protein
LKFSLTQSRKGKTKISANFIEQSESLPSCPRQAVIQALSPHERGSKHKKKFWISAFQTVSQFEKALKFYLSCRT